jgi:hypothetical protein
MRIPALRSTRRVPAGAKILLTPFPGRSTRRRGKRAQESLDHGGGKEPSIAPLPQVLEAQQHVGVAFGAVHLQPTRS